MRSAQFGSLRSGFRSCSLALSLSHLSFADASLARSDIFNYQPTINERRAAQPPLLRPISGFETRRRLCEGAASQRSADWARAYDTIHHYYYCADCANRAFSLSLSRALRLLLRLRLRRAIMMSRPNASETLQRAIDGASICCALAHSAPLSPSGQALNGSISRARRLSAE